MTTSDEFGARAAEDISGLLSIKNWWKAYFLAWLPLGLAYLIVLGAFVDITGTTLVTTWIANILFPSLISIGVVWLTLKEIVYQRPPFQIALHTVGAIVYSVLWALTLFRLLQLFSGLFTGDWSPPVWPSPVIAWQLFQGIALYFIVVSGTYAYWALSKLKRHGLTVKSEKLARRIYARSPNGLVPVAADEIAAIMIEGGATMIFLERTKLEARLSLSELEAVLPRNNFVRVHKSAMINLDQVQSVEPAGNGRQSIHLKNGLTIDTSRAGATALKSRFAIV